MRLRAIVFSILIFVLAVMGIFKIYAIFHRPSIHQLNPDLQWLGVIDLDNTHDVSLNAVLNGEDAILVLDHTALLYQEMIQKIPQTKYLTLDELFHLYNLHLLDSNTDGIINAQDPIFQHLFIIQFYDKGAQYNIKNLSAAGIRGIYTNIQTPTGTHLVLMSDGTQRVLYSVTKFEKLE